MPRIARVVAPGVAHHITQRGSRRQPVFFSDADRRRYLTEMARACRRCGVQVWAYCLMPNHVHLIAVPECETALAVAVGEAHRRYSWVVNRRQGWRGYLWQYRFSSCPLDEEHLLAAVRYAEQNPVRAGLVTAPADWPWSSARAHLARRDDGLVVVRPMLERVSDWADYLASGLSTEVLEALRRHERTGRPLGGAAFVARLEEQLGRVLTRGRPGPRPASA